MHFLAALPVFFLFLAAASDLRWRVIPNSLTAALATTGACVILLSDNPTIVWSALAAVIVLAGGTALFALGIMGGGDVKLAAALTLWLPPGAVPSFLVLTALAGGLLGLLMLLGHLGHGLVTGRGLRTALATGMAASAPYGVAIAAGGIAQIALERMAQGS